ncbi:MAG: acetyl-CoA carboxylase carboxyltransferase subunit alpha [Chthonomonas sp.]|nr:acetyl-CoA carboxylase carboxyltransferase subunit alpha [Chthonomonas sp.]
MAEKMRPTTWKQWEKNVLDLEDAVRQLKELLPSTNADRRAELENKISTYEKTLQGAIKRLYESPDPWEKVLIARCERRPYTLDLINAVCTNFIELQGDRRFGVDNAIIGGPARIDGRAVMVIGHQKGRNIQERQMRNFAMSKPEGYRKAIRLMDMADRFGLPIVTFVDTPAADPGVESESRGISEAIAAAIQKMFEVEVPIVSAVIGEGGSGGAIGIAVANRIMMLEHAVYSVIPPEGCAAILWRRPEMGPEAAAALNLTAQNALELKLVDEIVPEGLGGFHRNQASVMDDVKTRILGHLDELSGLSRDQLKKDRYEKFRKMGRFSGQ